MKKSVLFILLFLSIIIPANSNNKYHFWFNQEEYRQQQADRSCQTRCLIDNEKYPRVYTRLSSEYKEYVNYSYLGYGTHYDCVSSE